jgi:arabinan endo-1,5-alpha-L-arabinosidase
LCFAVAVPAEEPKLAVIPFNTPDPTAVEAADGSGVYVFTTGRGINVIRSTNLVDWERLGRVFKEYVPEWTQKAVPGSGGIWAPDIVFHNGKYYLYYSVSTFGGQRSVIGLAINKTLNPNDPNYEWTDQGIVLESAPDRTDYNAIDSAMFVDDDGRAYLFWGSYWTGIKAVEIDAATGKPMKYRSGTLKIPDGYIAVAQRESEEDVSLEAAYIVKHGNHYYLFTSRGSCCDGIKSSYHIAVGRAASPLGPYIDKDGKRMDAGGGTVMLSSTEKWKGTGHNGFFRTVKEKKNQDWLILAAYDAEAPKKGRLTQIRPITWDDSGWFHIGDVLDRPME